MQTFKPRIAEIKVNEEPLDLSVRSFPLLQQQHHRFNPYAFPIRNYDPTRQRYSPVSVSNSEGSPSSVEPSSPRSPEAAISPTLDLSTSERSRGLKMISMRSLPFGLPVRDLVDLQETVRRVDVLLENDPLKSLKQSEQRLIAEYNENIPKNTNMRRNSNRNETENRDKAYWEKREKNNDAARRSRNKRKAIGDSTATTCEIVMKDNAELRAEIKILRSYSYVFQMARQF